MNDHQRQAKREWSRRHREALREMGLNAHGEPYAVPDTDTRRGGTGTRYVNGNGNGNGNGDGYGNGW